jgi:iron only hydrogenase large subunit-like protein
MEFIFSEAVVRLKSSSITNSTPSYHSYSSNYKELCWEEVHRWIGPVSHFFQDGLKLKFVAAYGFRQIQSVIKSLQQPDTDIDFVEFMACPGACTNGGGQIISEEPDLLSKVCTGAFQKSHLQGQRSIQEPIRRVKFSRA